MIPSKDFIEDIKRDCINAALIARDFCGNQRQAMKDAAKDRGVNLSESTIDQLMWQAESEWILSSKIHITEDEFNDLRK
jgi:hypothetical protein